MFRHIIISLVILVSSFSCTNNIAPTTVAGKPVTEKVNVEHEYQTSATDVIYCLRDLLVGEVPGGVWTIITAPAGFSPDLSTDNPCINFTIAPAGYYTLRYTVTTPCCSNYTDVNLVRCGMTGTSSCSS